MRYLLKHKRYGSNGDVDDWFEFAEGEWHDCPQLEQRLKDALDKFAAAPFVVCHSTKIHGVEPAVPEMITIERVREPNADLLETQRKILALLQKDIGREPWEGE